MTARPVTAIVEPTPGGHRLQWVSHVARAALSRGHDVVLLTSEGGGSSPQFRNFLGDLDLEVREPFDNTYAPQGAIEPPVPEVAAALVALHRERPIHTYVIPEADRILKTWWRVCPPELRSRRGGPEGVLMYGRFPSRISWEDRADILHRVAKTGVAALARLRGCATRVVFLVGRDDTTTGWLLKRVRDPAICSAHASQRAELRARYELPPDRRLVSILGSVSMRKCPPMVLDAAIAAGPDVDLLLAGVLWDDVLEWLDQLEPEKKARLHTRIGFLDEEEIDAYVAASDINVAAHLNRGPSGIMGKAQVAGVPILSAGSKIRRTEAAAFAGGLHTDLTAAAIATGIRELLARGTDPLPVDPTLPTAEEFGAVVLGLPPTRSLAAARRG